MDDRDRLFLFPALRENSEKPPNGVDLSVLPFLGFPAVGSGPQASNQDGKLPNRAFFSDEERTSTGFPEESIMVATHSWKGISQHFSHPESLGFDLAPSIRLRWRAERALPSVCPSGERPTTATGKSRATVAGGFEWKSASKGPRTLGTTHSQRT